MYCRYIYQNLKTVHQHGSCAKETFEVADGNQCLSLCCWGCLYKSWVHKTLKCHTFPTDKMETDKSGKFTTNYKWKASDRVCSAHLTGGHKYGGNNIPAVSPRRDLKTGDIVWPVDISGLLQEKSYVAETEKNKSTSTDEVRERVMLPAKTR